jgi:putative NADH-flavin reductase
MFIALFGATGRVGTRVLEYALAEGHTVRALVRDPATLEKRPGLDIMKGDVLDIPSVERAIKGTGAVISTLGGKGLEDPGEAQSRGMKNIVTAMTKLGVKRVLGVGGSGILDSVAGGLRHDQSNFLPVFRPVSMRHQQAWEAMRGSDSDWTMIACPDIAPGERTGTYRVVEDRLPEQGKKISVEDVADCLLKELREGKYLKKRIGVAY